MEEHKKMMKGHRDMMKGHRDMMREHRDMVREHSDMVVNGEKIRDRQSDLWIKMKNDLNNNTEILSSSDYIKNHGIGFRNEDPVESDEDAIRLVEEYKKLESAENATQKRNEIIMNGDIEYPHEGVDVLAQDGDKLMCAICFSNMIKTIITPCNHAILCIACSKEIATRNPKTAKCPACNGSIQKISIFYLG